MEKNRIRPPLHLLIVNAIGSLLFGLGLAEYIDATSLVPAAWQFEHYALVMLSAGALLMVPLTRFLVRAALAHVADLESRR
ncbi:MAG: chemotaxis protein [endosymbiont of Escarpia spicata]|uniref:Chemotaxis protein n=1 Tax=endosymbiont of Escarpia spicata TaxID=2200908 RepID=A0A370DEG1_9GAMM|nr:MAG: chemotaxis protein [endosymbiont of Escarpia spicata]